MIVLSSFKLFRFNTEERNLKIMAYIIESERRVIKLSVDDVLNVIREYQKLTHNSCCYEHTREILAEHAIFIPEDL